MKILFVITGLGMGGAEHVVTNLADELVKLGHEVKIVYLTGNSVVLPKNTCIELIPIGMTGSKDLIYAYLKLRKVVNRFQPDVVHSHMFHSNILSRLLRLSTKIPKIVTTAHNTNEGGKYRMLAYRLTDKLADISTNVSEEAVNSFVAKKATHSSRMVSVSNGINTNEFYFDPTARKTKRLELKIENKKLILCVGRLEAQKDYPNLFLAISHLKESRQDFKVSIVGDGTLRNNLNEMVDKLQLHDYISFLGVRRDVKDLMSAADIYVMSSAWEGFGLVVAEAMACERFVVATDCGGVKEVVGSNGVLVEPKNHHVLAQELDKSLDMTIDERLKVGAVARQHIIDNYSLNANVSAYLELYSN